MSDDLAAVFDDSPSDEKVDSPEPEQVTEPEPTSTEESTEGEKPIEKSEQPKVEKSEEDDFTPREKAFLAAKKDEIRKRQDREKELEELKAKLAESEKKPLPDIFEDQEGYTQAMRTELQLELTKAKLDMGREMMKSFRDDYEEVEAMVLEEVKSNPVLKAELQKSPNIAKAVYEYGKKLQEFNQVKGFDAEAERARIREEERAKLLSETREKPTEAELSPSLATARGSTVQSEPEPDPSDIEALFVG